MGTMSSNKLSTKLIGKYQDAFKKFCNRAGCVASCNVIFILRSIGQNPSQADVQDLVGQVDKDGTGSIDFPEFLQMMTLKYEEENAEDEIRTAFQVFDSNGNGNGFINRYELSAVMNNIGEQVTGDEIQALMDEADLDGDGQINYEEFFAMMNSCKF